MENLPYDFIEKVLTMATNNVNHFAQLEAPLWKEAARVRKQKSEYVQCSLAPYEQGYQFICMRHAPGDQASGSTELSFDEMRSLDDRFIKILEFGVKPAAWINPKPEFQLPVDRLRELMEFISRFPIEQTQILLAVSERRLGAALLRHELNSLRLSIIPNLISTPFCMRQLNNPTLREAYLTGDAWIPRLKPDILTFVCRPDFKVLQTTHQAFNEAELRQIVDYWKNMDVKWENSTIAADTGTDAYEKFAPWMPAVLPESEGQHKFREECGDFELVVTCDNDCKLVFRRFKISEDDAAGDL